MCCWKIMIKLFGHRKIRCKDCNCILESDIERKEGKCVYCRVCYIEDPLEEGLLTCGYGDL